MLQKMKKSTFSLLATLLLLSIIVLSACGQPETDVTAPESDAPEVEEAAPEVAENEVEEPETEETEAEEANKFTVASAEEGEALARSLDPDNLPAGWVVPENIGYVVNLMVHEWYQNLTSGTQIRADEWGADLTLIDANLDLQVSLAGIDDLLATEADVILFTPVDQGASAPPIQKAMDAGVPVVLESSPVDGAITLVSIDDYQLGFSEGVWAGNWWMENMEDTPRILSITVPQLGPCVNRSDGFIDGMTSIIATTEVAAVVDGKGLKDEAIKVAADAITANPDINVITGCNDDSTFGGLQAYQAAGLPMDMVLGAGFGCEGNACKDALMEGGPYKVSAAMFPEYQGSLLIDTAIVAYNGAPLPDHMVVTGAPVTAETLSDYYTKDGDIWVPNFDAIAALNQGGDAMEPEAAAEPEVVTIDNAVDGEALTRSLDPNNLPAGWEVPDNIGYVVNLMVHEWYQNLTSGTQIRADEWGADLTLIDANLDLQVSLAGIDDLLATEADVILFTPVDQGASAPPIQKAMDAGVPVVLESSPVDGATTLVSIDDYQLGFSEGVWAGNWWMENMEDTPRILSITVPQLGPCVNRSDGFIDGMTSIIATTEVAAVVDGKGLKDEAIKVAADAITANPDINVITGCNDDSTFGGLQAYQAAGLPMDMVLGAGFGCEGNACKDALMEGGPYKVSAAMFPEFQGSLLIDTAIAAYNGVPLPDHMVVTGAPVTAETLSDYYTKDGDTWVPNFAAIADLNK